MKEKIFLVVYYLFFISLVVFVYQYSTEVAIMLVVMLFVVTALRSLGSTVNKGKYRGSDGGSSYLYTDNSSNTSDSASDSSDGGGGD